MEHVRISKQRQLITYSDFWNASRFLFEQGQTAQRGSYYQFLASLIFSAFTYEAFLNHVGEHLLECWPEVERKLSPRAKLSLIAERLNIKVDYGRLPWQIIPGLLGFRDKIAHGKNEMIRLEKTIPMDSKYEEVMHEFLFADWQNFAIEKNVVRIRQHLEDVLTTVHRAANIKDDFLFRHGDQVRSASLVRRE
ncbi:MAG: hypothetical protein WDZ63_00235 [Burkholderiales bacterium]